MKLVCTHFYSNDDPMRDIISLAGVRGRNISHSWPQMWAILMLNPVRPWTALQNPRTGNPLITTSLPSFQPWDILYNICAPKSDNSSSNLPSYDKPYTVFAIMCIPVCMWCHWPCKSPPTCCVHKPPCSCPNPCPNEMAYGPLFDSHLMTFWSYPQQTRALIKEELIHTRRTS